MAFLSMFFRKGGSVVAVIMAAVLMLTSPAQAALSFTDVSERYTDAVNYLVENGLTEGLTETEFGTQQMIKRVDAAVLLAKALNLEVSDGATSGFTDVPTRAEPYIAALRAKGIIQGKDATTFAAQDNITRGEMALILARGYELTAAEKEHPFVDVSERYQDAVSSLYLFKITIGKTETTFATHDNLTRGEFALFLYRLSNLELPDEEEMIRLDVLDSGLYDGSISEEKLLTNQELLLITFAMDEGFKKGDTVRLGTADLNLLTLTLEDEEDLAGGFVYTGFTKDFLRGLSAGQTIELIATVERGGTVLGTSTKQIKLPVYPLVKPSIDAAKISTADLAYILSGEIPLRIDIIPEGLEQVEPGNKLSVMILSEDRTETFNQVIADADITNGFVNFTFTDSNIIQRLLKGITTGSTIELTPALSDGETTRTGDTVQYVVTAGLLASLEDLLDGSGELPPGEDVVSIDLLNNGLLDGSISTDELLSNPELVRVTLLPGSGLAIGDVLKLATDNFNLLTLSLTEADLARGFVDVGISTDLLVTLSGGETLDLVAIVERGEAILARVSEQIKLPIFPLVEPVIDVVKNTLGDLSYILAGKKTLQVGIEAEGLEQLDAGDTLILRITSSSHSEDVSITITDEDIDNGYVNYPFKNNVNLLERLLAGVTTGSSIEITPIITDGDTETPGNTVNYAITKGLLSSLKDLLGGVLGGLLEGLLGRLF